MKMKNSRKRFHDSDESTSSTTAVPSIITQSLLSDEMKENLSKSHKEATPYNHLHIQNMFDPEILRKVQEEALVNLKATFKESDLFKVYQTIDMGNLDSFKAKDKAKMVNLFMLKDYLYSNEFRNFVSQITGCTNLIDRVDCSMNIYTNGCHLLCHDDVIGTRRVSYIIYLTDADDEWKVEDGGAVELYPLDPSSTVNRPEMNGLQGIPTATPTTNLLPTFNSMVIFAVQPGRSYHSVQEVFSVDKSRLSISGWFHGPTPPVGSDLASLKQIMTRGDDTQIFTPFDKDTFVADDDTAVGNVGSDAKSSSVVDEADTKKNKSNNKKSKKNKSSTSAALPLLSTEDSIELAKYINPEYLKTSVLKQVNEAFIIESSLQLKDFLKSELAYSIEACIKLIDEQDKLGNGRVTVDYNIGTSTTTPTSSTVDDNKTGWTVVGPSHKLRYLKYDGINSNSSCSSSSSLNINNSTTLGDMLSTIQSRLFQSPAFARYLKLITSLTPLSHRGVIRRFRPGLDYTVAHYGGMTKEPRLDATLCFVGVEPAGSKDDGEKKSVMSSDSDDDDDDEEDEDDYEEDEGEEDEGEDEDEGFWESGDVGGFECYIEAEVTDDADGGEAAEVFQTGGGYGAASKSTTKKAKTSGKDGKEESEKEGGGEKENTSLLSISPGFNVLSLVMRDDGVMRFIKYVSANAPSSRWDVSVEYEYDNTSSSSGSDKD